MRDWTFSRGNDRAVVADAVITDAGLDMVKRGHAHQGVGRVRSRKGGGRSI
jgi:hypothetical protein